MKPDTNLNTSAVALLLGERLSGYLQYLGRKLYNQRKYYKHRLSKEIIKNISYQSIIIILFIYSTARSMSPACPSISSSVHVLKGRKRKERSNRGSACEQRVISVARQESKALALNM
jgi:hypothetical protein